METTNEVPFIYGLARINYDVVVLSSRPHPRSCCSIVQPCRLQLCTFASVQQRRTHGLLKNLASNQNV